MNCASERVARRLEGPLVGLRDEAGSLFYKIRYFLGDFTTRTWLLVTVVLFALATGLRRRKKSTAADAVVTIATIFSIMADRMMVVMDVIFTFLSCRW